MSIPLLRVIIVILGTTCIFVQTMERNSTPLDNLNKYISDVKNESDFTDTEYVIIKATYGNMHETLLSCSSEEQVYDLVWKDYHNKERDLLNLLKSKDYITITSKEGTKESFMYTHEKIKQAEDFHKEHGCKLFKESLPAKIDNQAIFWKNQVWENTVLIPKKELGLVYEIAHFFGIKNIFFITAASEFDNLISTTFDRESRFVLAENYGFILNISSDTRKNLTSNPALCIPILLHQFNKLFTGYGVKKIAINYGTQKLMLDGKSTDAPHDKSLIEKKLDWEKAAILFSDIAPIICPPGNQTFNIDERRILYRLALKSLCTKTFYHKAENDKLFRTRVATFLHLYHLISNNT